MSSLHVLMVSTLSKAEGIRMQSRSDDSAPVINS